MRGDISNRQGDVASLCARLFDNFIDGLREEVEDLLVIDPANCRSNDDCQCALEHARTQFSQVIGSDMFPEAVGPRPRGWLVPLVPLIVTVTGCA